MIKIEKNWKSIEQLQPEPIWVLMYYMYSKDGNFVPSDTPGALKTASCHGYYLTEADAIKVRNNFPHPNVYHIEKVYKRTLL